MLIDKFNEQLARHYGSVESSVMAVGIDGDLVRTSASGI
jgi:hypothetical protein